MGICLSCLNRDLDRDFSDEDEQSQLLYEDPPAATNYGSFGHRNSKSICANQAEAQRANKALTKVVTNASNHLVDIFAMVPQEIAQSTTTALFSIPNDHPKFYKSFMAKLSVNYPSELPELDSSNSPVAGFDGWELDRESLEKPTGHPRIVSDGIGPFLSNFKDPASGKE
ncbi:hypothetical protein OnM2_044056 [Erysiphe neolycopersici]|uniref:Late endosomal/lysosomal adaptor and MAPK and MTOR activator 1 n=1 Tax=Erysiphe neolycopersici TaxID=212602 RepID=A0A420HUV1_9PEZI|nr:hypothetical protein OnM2_044056 [Erysiphe neolycopersici]